ncbi:branched-chain amino acid ABC transporter permease [Siculibacillus lacustris]|uniref:Branched-chain amino acid ABC transporter permease n=1 Tax=Siculibacillus lacustris TaxID=1549641 RepID=A0A4Q9VMZ9_9HYPH|nr:branched-chain amino acid ABC transporter permease [Siculibacillus lacustris]TBW36995.1 branched-chain amino acid ABC transporter permease [Siculibacillus lacustris]
MTRALARRVAALLLHPATAIVGLALAVALAEAFGWNFAVTLATRAAILALAALSLSFVIGQGGMVSFGHAAPFGIGAYAVLIAGEYGIREVSLLLPLAFLAAAAFAVPTGALALRTRGVYFIMITLAFAQMAYFVFAALSAFGGDDGMGLAGRATFAGARFLRSDGNLAWLSVGLLAAAAWVLHRVVAARFGFVLRAARDDEARVSALGFSVYRTRLVAYALGAGIAGLAGALLAEQTAFVSPALMNWHRSGELIVMVVLGGSGRLAGAVLGAIAVVLVEEFLGGVTEYWKLGLGLLILAVVMSRAIDLRALLARIAR